MLRKLLKYECKATARTFGSLYLAMLVVALLLGVTFGMERMDAISTLIPSLRVPVNGSTFGTNMVAVGLLVYGCLVIAMGVLLCVTICQRFYKNLLGSEGYLMHTLPVSTAALVLSKLLVSVLWLALSGVVLVVTLVVLVIGATRGQIFSEINWMDYLLIRPDGYILTMLPLLLCQYITGILSVYLAMMLGHQVKKGGVPVAIVSFFVISAAKSYFTLWSAQPFIGFLQKLALEQSFWYFYGVSNLISIAYEVLFAALYFAATAYLLRKRLNLV